MKLVRRMSMAEFGMYLNGTYVKSYWENKKAGKDDDGKTYFFPLESLIEKTHREDIKQAIYFAYCTVWGTEVYDNYFYPLNTKKGIYNLPCFGEVERTLLMPCVICIFDVDDNIPHINTSDYYGACNFDEVLLDGYDNKIAKIDKIFMPKCVTWETLYEDTLVEDIIDATDVKIFNNELYKYMEFNNDKEYAICHTEVTLYNWTFEKYIRRNNISYKEKCVIRDKLGEGMWLYTMKDVENTFYAYMR